MTEQGKQLLFQDLSARLPYGVICQVDVGVAGLDDGKLEEIDIPNERVRFADDGYWDADIDDVKPYLRPLSSMTEEEKSVLHNMLIMRPDFTYGIPLFREVYKDKNWVDNWDCCSFKAIDWLNKHHFDYHGLIERGLAIEVTEEHNPYKS